MPHVFYVSYSGGENALRKICSSDSLLKEHTPSSILGCRSCFITVFHTLSSTSLYDSEVPMASEQQIVVD